MRRHRQPARIASELEIARERKKVSGRAEKESLALDEDFEELHGVVYIELYSDGRPANIVLRCEEDEREAVMVRALYVLTEASKGFPQLLGDDDA